MKDLTEYFDSKSTYEKVYGEDYSKSLKRDLKRINYKKRYVFLIPTISLVIYFSILLLSKRGIDVGSMLSALGMIGMQVPGMLNLKKDINRFKENADLNLKELLRILFRKDEQVSLECLQNSVITSSKEKEKVEYRECDTNKVIINHEIKTTETRIYFKDTEEQLKCLKELRQVVTFQGEKEESHTLELLDEDDLVHEEIPNKVKKKLMQ